MLATRWDRDADAREFEQALAPAWRSKTWRQANAGLLVSGDAGPKAALPAHASLRSLSRR